MEITIIDKDKITLTELPEKVRGRYPVNRNNGIITEPCFYVEEQNDQWTIVPENNIYYRDLNDSAQNYKKAIPLKNGGFLEAKDLSNNTVFFITAEDKRSEDVFFKKYMIPKDGVIRIGRNSDNTIQYNNKFMDSHHAEIRYDNRTGKIHFKEIGTNNQTKNGSFINSKKVVNTELHYGDIFYFMGLKIVIAKDYIAVNNPKRSVALNLEPFEEKRVPVINSVASESEIEFSQSPRIYQKIEPEKIKLSSPPTDREERSTPWLLMYGPSIAMGIASIVSSFYSVYSITASNGDIMSAMPMLIFAVAMLFGMIICPLLARNWEKNNNLNRRAVQEREYINELVDAEKRLQTLKREQRDIILSNNPSLSVLEDRILKNDVNLWERSIRHEDFLEIPFGRGNTDLKVDIEAPSIPKETMQQIKVTLNQFLSQNRQIEDVPVTFSLYENPFLGVVGNRLDVIKFARALILEMVSLHSYDELKLAFIYDESEKDLWEFAKWLPHTWSNDMSENYIAENLDQVKLLSNSLTNVIEMREKLDDSTIADEVPHYVIIAADRTLAEKAMALKKLYADHKNVRFSVIALYNEKKFLPRSFDTYIAIDGQLGNIVNLNKIEESVRINNVVKYNKSLDKVAIKLANTKLDVVSAENSLPENVTLFEMLKIKQPENFDSLTKWSDNDATKSLAVPIGVDEDGYSIMLDIHEKAHGPHGLIAGMTGSGKSEFIISYIASLAMNFDPEDVSFILVDFKGGGMGDTFKNLPHVVGSVTNLDGNELNRSLVAIESELVRRQQILKDASEKYGISNIDIYRYQAIRNDLKAQSRGHELEPFPHLVIIVDEFAELKQQNEEFLNQLIRIARIGRSLGVHLILATQKPDGVVNDQITSNIRFKVCLKVQSSGDSQSVIGGPEAAMLTKTGQFYLQVGYNELFELGQAAWAGAPYVLEEDEHVSKAPIRLFDSANNELAALDTSLLRSKNSASTKQVDELIDYLDEISASANFEPKKLWIPPLQAPEIAQQQESEEKQDFMIAPVVGLYDDVSEQTYKPLDIDFFNRGNTIIYGAPGSGNIEFLNRLIYEGIKDHDDDEIIFDLLDFDSGSLIAFEDAPQVKNVIMPHEKERINNFFDSLKDELSRRKELFVPYGGNYQSYVTVSGEKMPIIVVVLDNYTNFVNTYIDGAENLEQLAREGTNYGIFFVVTASNSNSISYRMVPNFGQIYVLQQNNDDEYFNILGRHDHMKPSPYIGRGIFKKSDKTYEFQVNILFNDRVNRFKAIQEFCRQLARDAGITVSEPELIAPVQEEEETLDYSLTRFIEETSGRSGQGWPVGWDEDQILYQSHKGGILPVVFDDETSELKKDFLFDQIVSNEPGLVVVDYNDDKVEEATQFYDDFVEDFIELLQERNAAALAAHQSGKALPTFKECSFIIPDYWKFLTSLSFEQNYRWKEIVEYIEPGLGLNLIVGTDVDHSPVILDSIYGGVKNAIWCGKDFSSQKWYHGVEDDLTHDSVIVQAEDDITVGRLPDMAA